MRRRVGALLLGAALVLSGPAAMPVQADENQAPVAVDDPPVPGCQAAGAFGGAFPIPEDFSYPAEDDFFTWLDGCLPTANDYDPDGDLFTLELVGQPAHGEASYFHTGSNQWLRYRADPDYSTLPGDVEGGEWFSDAIPYRITDNLLWSNTAAYRIWLAPINDAPSFTPGAELVEGHAGGAAVSVAWATEIDPGPYESHQAVSFEVETDTNNAPGMFSVLPAIDGDGTLTFTPGTEPGLATITVTAVDDGGLEDWGMSAWTSEPPADTSGSVAFQVVVWPADGPVAVDDEATLDEDSAALIDVLANDSGIDETVTISAVTAGELGTAEVVESVVVYTPNPDATGDDSFTYTIEDEDGGQATATVEVTITPVNDDPDAAGDTLTLGEGCGPTPVDVLANDDDVDGDELAVQALGQAAHGLVTLLAGQVGYEPEPGFAGSDSFTYTVTDGEGGTDTATVTVTVTPDTVAPIVAAGLVEVAGSRLDTDGPSLRFRWSAVDAAPGVASQTVQQQRPSGSWRLVDRPVPGVASIVLGTGAGTTEALRVRATDARGNTSDWAPWPQVEALVRQETSSSIDWSGTWKRGESRADSGGATRWTGASGRRATIETRARAIAWVGRRQPDGGRADVWVDGVKVATIDTEAGAMERRAILFRVAWAGRGLHEVQLRTLGGGRVDVDAFVIVR